MPDRITMVDPIERCPKCGAVIALVGRIHNCRPRDPVAEVAPVAPRPKLAGGAAVKVKKSSRGCPTGSTGGAARVATGAVGANPKPATSSRGGVESRHARADQPSEDTASWSTLCKAPELTGQPSAGAAPGPREAKLRAKKGTAVYAHRDADKHRDYQKKLMKARRAKTKTLAEA